MKYIMLIYQGPALERQAALPEEEQKQVYADYQGINQTPGVTPGLPMGLPENATTVRVEAGTTLTTDGPFVGMKEAVGGWFILEADDLDAAIEVAARVPAAPVVELNRAIAIAETEGPEAGLRLVGQLGLDDFRYLHSTKAELLRRLGRTGEARDAYRRARELTDDGAERRFLERRLTELAATTGSG
jgi:hypothetical protein